MIKKILLFSFISIVTFGIVSTTMNSAHSNGSGAPTGNTGSPADNKTCAQTSCHPGPATAIAGAITSDVPASGYIPGNTYTITATVSDPSIVKFGFQISPQNTAGTLLGTMALLNTTTTKFTSASSKYITHKSTGTSFPSHTASWSFSWTAPVSGTGTVTFYGAFNFTNNNEDESGDQIRTSTLTIQEDFGVGIDDAKDLVALQLYPNPATDNIQLSYSLNSTQPVVISLYNLSGSKITELVNETQQAGNYNAAYSLSDYSTGVYMIVLKTGEQTLTRKVVKL